MMAPQLRHAGRFLGALTLLLWGLAVLLSGEARAEGRPSSCQRAAHQWADRCAADQLFAITPLFCSPEFATFRVDNQGSTLDIEVRSRPDGSFRPLAKRGLSPIGEYPDWKSEPAELRALFDRFTECVQRDAMGEIFGESQAALQRRGPTAEAYRAPIPWRMIGALASALALTVSSLWRAHLKRWLTTGASLFALFLATFSLRGLFYPKAFFHQNGHGAMWINCALGGHCSYGPGFRELFGWAAALDIATADQGVFLAHALLAATAPISAWLIARASGASRAVAWALASILAVDPIASRLAQSESYFGVASWLLFGAAALLAQGARFGPSSLRFTLAISGAGLLIAKAVVIHPIAWIPSALVPLVVLMGKEDLGRALRSCVAAGLGSAFVALVSSGALVLEVYREHSRWGGLYGKLALQGLPFFLAVALVSIVGIQLTRQTKRLAALRALGPIVIQAGALGLALILPAKMHALRGLTPWIHVAWWVPYLPLAIAAVAALSSSFQKRPIHAYGVAAIVLLSGGTLSLRQVEELTQLPTDALEANWVMSWREQLPEGARVHYLQRAEHRIFVLPIYRGRSRDIQAVPLRVESAGDPPEARSLKGYYYRSSLCSGEEGRPFCDWVERNWVLEPVHIANLPALPSMPHLPYDTDTVDVGLFRIINAE